MGAIGSSGDNVWYISVVRWKLEVVIMCPCLGSYSGTNI